MATPFLAAEWRKLLMMNYAVNPAVLLPYVPKNTELDLWEGTCYVSLVGFMFLNTRLKGIPIPFHRDFEEVNLRFYVKYKEGNEWRRGVVFIKEIVPKPALTWVANFVYKEHYETLAMSHKWEINSEEIQVSYAWKKGNWHKIEARAVNKALSIAAGSEPEFITEHYWGYTSAKGVTSEYGVEHPRWEVYEVKSYQAEVDFGQVYGKDFAFLNEAKPVSVFLAEGSEIKVNDKRILS